MDKLRCKAKYLKMNTGQLSSNQRKYGARLRDVAKKKNGKMWEFFPLGFRRPSAAKTLAGSWGGDQSGRINSSHSVIQEFARSDWMRLSGGDQSERINSSHSVIQEFKRFARSD